MCFRDRLEEVEKNKSKKEDNAYVYDLKDHPDFKFRPGSTVIRVMNKAGNDCGLGGGQVLDNQPGKVHIHLDTNKKISKCCKS